MLNSYPVGKVDGSMAHCPSCGTEIDKPSKVLKNHVFRIEGYDCDNCNSKFKIAFQK